MESFNFKNILLLIGLSSIGIILFQVNWLYKSNSISEQNFKESALQSMKEVKNAIVEFKQTKDIDIDVGISSSNYFYESTDSLFTFSFYPVSQQGYQSYQPNFSDDFINTLDEVKNTFLERRDTSGSIMELVTLVYLQTDTLETDEYAELNIDSILTKNLLSNNITLKYTVGFKEKDTEEWEHISGVALKDTSSLSESKYVLETMPEVDIYLHFYNKNSFLNKSLLSNIIVSSLLVLVILFSFWYTVRVILNQKKLSQIKTDFINNMTHEFKTPLATIGTAAATIEEPEIIKNEEIVRKFTSVIKEENERMNKQVESILEIAQNNNWFDNLEKKEVDLNEIIINVINQNSLRAEKKNGILKYVPNAKSTNLVADEMHLHHSINNLVDNAIKYSYSSVDIVITSENNDDYLIIRVTDKGIGIKKEDEARVFEKFYRVSTKDTHNVKGFGLGLNYVKQIIEAHGGYVTLQRNKIGSTFSLFLPLK